MGKMPYTREHIISEVRKALQTPKTLYALSFINYKGGVDGERYTEIAAQELLNHVYELNSSDWTINRENYKTASHGTLAQGKQSDESKRDEEWLAKRLYRDCKKIDFIGEILDYQTPLKAVQTDKAGKIDIFSYNADTRTAYVLELKRSDSEETLLRCVLEAYTYWKTVHHANLLSSFGLPTDTTLLKAALIYKGSQPYRDFEAKDTAVRQLMRELSVNFIVIDDDCVKEDIV
jgi:hypothetical protein